MSVIVKGLKMPKMCGECPFRLVWCRERIYMEDRPDRCPLIELPEKHGRLIDADEMINEWDGCTYDGSVTLLLETRQTVIEAEGDEE